MNTNTKTVTRQAITDIRTPLFAELTDQLDAAAEARVRAYFYADEWARIVDENLRDRLFDLFNAMQPEIKKILNRMRETCPDEYYANDLDTFDYY